MARPRLSDWPRNLTLAISQPPPSQTRLPHFSEPSLSWGAFSSLPPRPWLPQAVACSSLDRPLHTGDAVTVEVHRSILSDPSCRAASFTHICTAGSRGWGVGRRAGPGRRGPGIAHALDAQHVSPCRICYTAAPAPPTLRSHPLAAGVPRNEAGLECEEPSCTARPRQPPCPIISSHWACSSGALARPPAPCSVAGDSLPPCRETPRGVLPPVRLLSA